MLKHTTFCTVVIHNEQHTKQFEIREPRANALQQLSYKSIRVINRTLNTKYTKEA